MIIYLIIFNFTYFSIFYLIVGKSTLKSDSDDDEVNDLALQADYDDDDDIESVSSASGDDFAATPSTNSASIYSVPVSPRNAPMSLPRSNSASPNPYSEPPEDKMTETESIEAH